MTPLALFLAFTALLPIQTGPDANGAEAILARYRAKLGTPEHLAARKSLTAHGRSTWVGLEGTGLVTEVYAGLLHARLTTEFPPFGTFEQGCDGTVVWEKNPLEIKLREGWDASQYARLYGVYWHADWREMYERATLVGVEELDGVRCHRLNLTPKALFPVTGDAAKTSPPPDVWWIDAESDLPRRIEVKSVGALDEPVMLRLALDDWRAVDGVLYPHVVRLEIGGFTLTIEYASFEHDRTLPEGFFELDAEVRAERERQADPNWAERQRQIVVEELEERHLASIRETCPHAEMQRHLTIMLPEAMQAVFASGATMSGQPLVRYHSWGDPVDLEAAIPVMSPIQAKGRVVPSTLPAGPAVVAWHFGPYDRLGETHQRIQAYLEEHGLEPRCAPWEEYWTDPGMEPDPSKWRTRVVWPIEPPEGDADR